MEDYENFDEIDKRHFINQYESLLEDFKEMKKKYDLLNIDILIDTFKDTESEAYRIFLREQVDQVPSKSEMRKDYINDALKEIRGR
jgi:hypothetical protein